MNKIEALQSGELVECSKFREQYGILDDIEWYQCQDLTICEFCGHIEVNGVCLECGEIPESSLDYS